MRCHRVFWLSSSLALIVLPCASAQRRAATPEDLFKIKNIPALALSPDGSRVAFAVRQASLSDNKYKSSLWLASLKDPSSPQEIAAGASSPQWSPDGRRLAYLAPSAAGPQIVMVDPESPADHLETPPLAGILSFQWNPNGSSIAILAREAAAPSRTGDDQGAGRRGVVIDKLTFNMYKLLGNDLFLDLARPVHLWLLHLPNKSLEPLITTFQVDEAVWAPDGLSLAVTGRESSELGVPGSIYLYSLSTRKAIPALRGIEKDHVATLEYSHPTWSPDGSELAVVAKISQDRWANSGALGILTLRTSAFRIVTEEPQLELYAPRFFWLAKLGLVIENTLRAETNLFEVKNDGSVTALSQFHGDSASFSFSTSGDRTAFVGSDIQHAPEIYVTRIPFRDTKSATALNAFAADLTAPLSERVHWSGSGGVEVEGWLLKPPGYTSGRRYPLLVMVHGGPGVAVKDSFEPYSLFSEWAWPYPFRIFAERGYLVFFPNYRGTGSYGKSFRTFRDMAGEPAEDIVSGIQALIRRGDVDPALIGILGHSHGGWLGPYVLTQHKRMFKAASFAEGALDAISQYGLLPGWLNLYTHEYYNPGTPYENLHRYIEMSPVFAMKDLDAPVLLEFGQRSLALLGLESVTALWREGVRHEMIVYPGEGHNLAAPQAQLESAYRNLDWFDYWMLGKKASSPNRQEQYVRWDKMAADMKKMRETHPLPR